MDREESTGAPTQVCLALVHKLVGDSFRSVGHLQEE